MACLFPVSTHGWAAAPAKNSSLGHIGHLPLADWPAVLRSTPAYRTALVACSWPRFWLDSGHLRASQDVFRTNKAGFVLHAKCTPRDCTFAPVPWANHFSFG